jgi:hypothetical protein
VFTLGVSLIGPIKRAFDPIVFRLKETSCLGAAILIVERRWIRARFRLLFHSCRSLRKIGTISNEPMLEFSAGMLVMIFWASFIILALPVL